MMCLLCGQGYRLRQTFSSIFSFQSTRLDSCPSCRTGFRILEEERCPSCCKPGSSEVCQDCHYWQSLGKTVSHTSLLDYNAALADYFSRYKFQGDYLLRLVFEKEMQQLLRLFPDFAVVPIPVSEQRLVERGFNQVEGLLEAAKIQYCNLLKKKETKKQSSKNRAERLALQQPFSIQEDYLHLLPEKIVLVDDIYTTGSTLMAAKDLLLQAGVKEVQTISLAR